MKRLAASGTLRPLGAMPDSIRLTLLICLSWVEEGSAAVLAGQQHGVHPHKWYCWAGSLTPGFSSLMHGPVLVHEARHTSSRLAEHWLAAAGGEASNGRFCFPSAFLGSLLDVKAVKQHSGGGFPRALC